MLKFLTIKNVEKVQLCAGKTKMTTTMSQWKQIHIRLQLLDDTSGEKTINLADSFILVKWTVNFLWIHTCRITRSGKNMRHQTVRFNKIELAQLIKDSRLLILHYAVMRHNKRKLANSHTVP